MALTVGATRHWVPPSRRDPHTVLRVSWVLHEVLIKYADRTTAWEPIYWYEANTEEDDGLTR